MMRSERNKSIQSGEIGKPLTRVWFWPNIQIKNKQLPTLGKFPKQNTSNVGKELCSQIKVAQNRQDCG